jgi:hypothetical protein
MRLGLAFRVFFAALFDAAKAQRLEKALAGPPVPVAAAAPATIAAKPVPAETKPIPAAKSAARSEALTFLAALQREARFLDIIQEPLSNYSDAQVGAAARDVLKNSASVVERFFGIRALIAQEEGSTVEVPTGYDPHRFRVVGNVSGNPPFRGQLTHHGWIASKCDLPAWSGSSESVSVIAPVEVEVGARG